MKHLTTLFLLIMVITSCSNNEKKQETVIIKTDTKELEEAQRAKLKAEREAAEAKRKADLTAGFIEVVGKN